MRFLCLICSLKYCSAVIEITSTYYTRTNEGLSSITGSDIWSTACNSPSCDRFHLSYNNFTNTTLSALDFRLNDNDEFENRVKYLDLSHNQIVEVSLEVFTAAVQVNSAWTLITLDLSYNAITDLSQFPQMNRGELRRLYLQNNRISQLGDLEILQKVTYNDLVTDFVELNLENNLLTEMPLLGFGNAFTMTDALIHVKNNRISQVNLTSCHPTPDCGFFWVRVWDFTNNELTAFTFEMIDWNWETNIFNFNHNKITHLTGFTPSDATAFYFVEELYFNDNEIVAIDTKTFDHFGNLTILELRNNRISSFPFANIFDTTKLPNLATVNLENNELDAVEDRTHDFPRTPSQQLNISVKGSNRILSPCKVISHSGGYFCP